MMAEQDKKPEKKKDEALPEKLFRKVFESVGEVVDRGLRRSNAGGTSTTKSALARMHKLIEERARQEDRDGRKGRIAPHVMKIKIEWGIHAESSDAVKQIEHEVLASAIDFINDHRYRTLGPIRVETETDVFHEGVSIEPSYGEFEEKPTTPDQAALLGGRDRRLESTETVVIPDISFVARALLPGGVQSIPLTLKPGGKRIGVGRGSDNELCLNHSSVSKIHAALHLSSDGKLVVADTGSTNGTHINGTRVSYGHAHPIEESDLVAFGDIEVRFRRSV
jgi:hypothetical protein